MRTISAGTAEGGIHAAAERGALWYWHAAGSGLWINTGRTYVDTERGRGERYWFGRVGTRGGDAHARELARQGFESLQLPVTVYNAQYGMPSRAPEIERRPVSCACALTRSSVDSRRNSHAEQPL